MCADFEVERLRNAVPVFSRNIVAGCSSATETEFENFSSARFAYFEAGIELVDG